jgi:hypothetical protein
MIGSIDHGRTTLTAAIVSAMANRSEVPVIAQPPPELGAAITINTAHVEYESNDVIGLMRPRRKPSNLMMAALPIMCGGFAGIPGFGGSRSAASIRHDPKRPKTEDDLERMEAARLKRERKAAREQNAAVEARDL